MQVSVELSGLVTVYVHKSKGSAKIKKGTKNDEIMKTLDAYQGRNNKLIRKFFVQV
jgi:hypothetical protein